MAITPPTWAEMQSLVQTINLQVLLLGQQHFARCRSTGQKYHPTPALAGSYAAGFAAPRLWPVRSLPVAGARGGHQPASAPVGTVAPLLHNAPLYNAPPSTTPPSPPPSSPPAVFTPPGGSFPPGRKLLGHLLPLLPKIQPRQPRHLSHPQALPLLTVRHPPPAGESHNLDQLWQQVIAVLKTLWYPGTDETAGVVCYLLTALLPASALAPSLCLRWPRDVCLT